MFLFSKLLTAITQPMFWLALWGALALLVTSAWHMPRSMAEFEAEFSKTGCKVTPYPVDFLTGESTLLTEYSLAHSLLRWQTALHEWLGFLVYGITR